MNSRQLHLFASLTAFAVVAGGLLAASSARAGVAGDAQVATASLTMSGDAGDYISQGRSFSFATPTDLFLAGTDATGTSVRIREISPGFTHWWELDFSAPDGEQLTPGTTYSGAARDAFRQPFHPGVDVSGDGSGCNTVSRSFEILDAKFGPNGYVESFHATFEQHCGANIPALRGEIQIANTAPAPPPALVQITIDPAGELGARGTATVHGTISCSVPPFNPYSASQAPTITVAVSEATKNGTVSLSNAAFPDACTPTPTRWTATTPLPYKGTPYVKGLATVAASTSIADPIYPMLADTASQAAEVQLKEG